MPDIRLFKEKKPYKAKDGTERIATNFFLQLGDARIPIEVKYFKGADGKDANYQKRKAVVEALAEQLPPKTEA